MDRMAPTTSTSRLQLWQLLAGGLSSKDVFGVYRAASSYAFPRIKLEAVKCGSQVRDWGVPWDVQGKLDRWTLPARGYTMLGAA
jgi:hypothetical protein